MTDGKFQFTETGGPEKLTWIEGEAPTPGAGEVTIRQKAIGVNYIDIYHLTGTYPLPLPSGIGMEGAGVIEAVGEGVTGFAPGDRVAYVGGPPNAYSTVRTVPAGRVVNVPDDISFEIAAEMTFKGVTAEYLIRRCYAVKPTDTVLVLAAAGGVGSIMIQWLKSIGATVIGVTSSDEKAAQVTALGADHVILSGPSMLDDLKAVAPDGVDVVYDSVGKDTFEFSLEALKMRGTFVSFGVASGPLPEDGLGKIGARPGIFFTKPSIVHYTTKREELEAGAAAVYDAISKGIVAAGSAATYPLAKAPEALGDLQARKTKGSLLLIP